MRGVAPHISMKFFFTFEVTQSDKKQFFDTMSNLAFQVHLGLLRQALPFSSPPLKTNHGVFSVEPSVCFLRKRVFFPDSVQVFDSLFGTCYFFFF